MKEQFVTYDIGLKLKELGFNEPCLRYYWSGANSLMGRNEKERSNSELTQLSKTQLKGLQFSKFCSLPLWQQAFDWFENEHKIYCTIPFISPTAIDEGGYMPLVDLMKPHKALNWYEQYPTKIEAKIASLNKMIELVIKRDPKCQICKKELSEEWLDGDYSLLICDNKECLNQLNVKGEIEILIKNLPIGYNFIIDEPNNDNVYLVGVYKGSFAPFVKNHMENPTEEQKLKLQLKTLIEFRNKYMNND